MTLPMHLTVAADFICTPLFCFVKFTADIGHYSRCKTGFFKNTANTAFKLALFVIFVKRRFCAA